MEVFAHDHCLKAQSIFELDFLQELVGDHLQGIFRPGLQQTHRMIKHRAILYITKSITPVTLVWYQTSTFTLQFIFHPHLNVAGKEY